MNNSLKTTLHISSLALATLLYSCGPEPATPSGPGMITENAIEWCGSIDEPTTWSNHTEGVDYVVTCLVQIKEDFTIEPGTEIVFEDDARFAVLNNALIAKGTAADPIYFRGKDGLAGEWDGIYFSSDDPANELSYCVISGGGADATYPGNLVVHKDSKVKVTNCTFSKSGRYGIYVDGGGAYGPTPFAAYANNTFTENTLNPISVNFGTVGQISGMGHTYTDNGEQAIEVREGRILENVVWKNANIPYHVTGLMKMMGGNLTVEAGVVMQFDAGAGLEQGIHLDKFIKLEGTAAQPIRMESFDPAGYWKGLMIGTNNSQSVMNYVVVDRAGENKFSAASAAGAVNVGSNNNVGLELTLNHCTISNSKGYGVTGYDHSLYDLVFPALNDMTYVNNALGNTFIDL